MAFSASKERLKHHQAELAWTSQMISEARSMLLIVRDTDAFDENASKALDTLDEALEIAAAFTDAASLSLVVRTADGAESDSQMLLEGLSGESDAYRAMIRNVIHTATRRAFGTDWPGENDALDDETDHVDAAASHPDDPKDATINDDGSVALPEVKESYDMHNRNPKTGKVRARKRSGKKVGGKRK